MTNIENQRTASRTGLAEISDFLVAAEPSKLWLKAAATLALYGNVSPDEVVELIGPYQDPDLESCVIAILTSPDAKRDGLAGAGACAGSDWELPANDDVETALSSTTR